MGCGSHAVHSSILTIFVQGMLEGEHDFKGRKFVTSLTVASDASWFGA